MKTRLLIIIAVFTLALIPVATNSFAEESFNGYSSIDPPLSEIVAGQSTVMTIRFLYTSGPYALNNFSPVIEVNPSSAQKFIQVDVDSIEITQGQIKRIPVTLTVDPHIEHEKIFLSISYVANHFRSGELQKSSWNDQIELDVKDRFVPEPEQEEPIFENCGPGTTYQDGICVVDKVNNSTKSSSGKWSGYPFTHDVESPLKQFKSGIRIDEIQCKESLILVIRHDGSPACVKLETKTKLMERGWMSAEFCNECNDLDDFDGLMHYTTMDASCNDSEGQPDGECFLNAFKKCESAGIKQMIYSTEGDPLFFYATIMLEHSCNIHFEADTSQDKYRGIDTEGIMYKTCTDMHLEKHEIIFQCDDEQYGIPLK